MIRLSKNVQMGSSHVFVVLRAHTRVLTPIKWLPLWCKLRLNINGVILGRSETFCDVQVKLSFMLTSIVWFNFYKLSSFWGILCMHVVKNMGQFIRCNCKMASPLWFSHLCMSTCGGAQQLGCPHLVDHKILHSFSRWI